VHSVVGSGKLAGSVAAIVGGGPLVVGAAVVDGAPVVGDVLPPEVHAPRSNREMTPGVRDLCMGLIS
jgi:hypothetical protein